MARSAGGKQSTLPLSSEVQGRLAQVANNQPCPLSSEVQWRLAQVASTRAFPSSLKCTGPYNQPGPSSLRCMAPAQ
eukprot:8837222-Prorocentrum_lima.AAC.1